MKCVIVVHFATDIDECSDATQNQCDEHAVCVNLNGAYTCHCIEGWYGDGFTCNQGCGEGFFALPIGECVSE